MAHFNYHCIVLPIVLFQLQCHPRTEFLEPGTQVWKIYQAISNKLVDYCGFFKLSSYIETCVLERHCHWKTILILSIILYNFWVLRQNLKKCKMVKSTFQVTPRRKLNDKIVCNIHFSVPWFLRNWLAPKLPKLVEVSRT